MERGSGKRWAKVMNCQELKFIYDIYQNQSASFERSGEDCSNFLK